MFYDRKKLFAGIKTNFKTTLTKDQVEGFEILVSEGEKRSVNTEWIAYILATAWHETGKTMQPIREAFASSDDQAISRLDAAFAKGKLGSVKTPYWRDGWFGRGYVQLTWKKNYEAMGKWLGVDLVNDPSKAMDPNIAAAITYEGMLRGMFTAKKLSDYLDGVDDSDEDDFVQYKSARRIINGTDKAALIATHAVKMEKALRAAETTKVKRAPTPKPRPIPKSDPIELPIEIIEEPSEDVIDAVKEVIEEKLEDKKYERAYAGTEDEEVHVPSPPHKTKPAVRSTTIWSAIASGFMSAIGMLGNLDPIIQGILLFAIIGTVAFIVWQRIRVSGAKDISGILK